MNKRVVTVMGLELDPDDTHQILNNLLWLLWQLKVIGEGTYPTFRQKDGFTRRHGKI